MIRDFSLERFKRTLLILGVLTVFLSKAAFNVVFALLGLTTIILMVKKVIKKRKNIKEISSINDEKKSNTIDSNDKVILLLLLAIPIGMVANFYSNGVVSLKKYLGVEPLMYTVLMFYILDFKRKDFKIANKTILFGGIVSALYTVLGNFNQKVFESNQSLQPKGRMGSFQMHIRLGAFLAMLLPMEFSNIFRESKMKRKILHLIVLVLFLYVSLLNGGRSTWLVAPIAIVFYIVGDILIKKNKKYTRNILMTFFLLIAIAFTGLKSNEHYYERAKSIFAVDFTKPIDFNSIEPSSRIRLQYMVIGKDMFLEKPIFGWGNQNLRELLPKYIETKDDAYRERYFSKEITSEIPQPFENQYLNNTVENGIIYTLWYHLGFVLAVVYFAYKGIKNGSKEDRNLIIQIIAMLIGTKMYFFFFPTNDRYVEFLNCIQLFYLKSLSKREE